ncbi:hypothetical protein HI914_02141 [Erysiphe necator]|nr:hypothetical protein HI914_02141 [Erysiphe necator]
MAQFFQPASNASPYANPTSNSQNLQFYSSSYAPGQIPSQPSPRTTFGAYGHSASPGFVSGRMGEQGGLRTGWLAAFGTEGYEGEPALLEELGVNFDHIWSKTLAVLNPLAHIDQHLMDDSDLAGPILFFFLFGTFCSSVARYILALSMDLPFLVHSGIFCAVGRMRGMRGLVAYPLALFYVGFGVMGVFSRGGNVKISNGKGSL